MMEYVDGEPITQYAQSRGASPAQRLALFVSKAAVQFAHQRLVVHRDPETRQLLVTRMGWSLLDFGIAKLIEDTGTAIPVTQQVMTSAYASPEQVRRGSDHRHRHLAPSAWCSTSC